VLVAGADEPTNITEQTAHPVEHLLAKDRVLVDDGALFGRERAWLVDDLWGDADLADVVEEGDEFG